MNKPTFNQEEENEQAIALDEANKRGWRMINEY